MNYDADLLRAQLAAVTKERDTWRDCMEARDRQYGEAIERLRAEKAAALAVIEAARVAMPFVGNYLGYPQHRDALEVALAAYDSARSDGEAR
jgi:hypothetical protein